MSESIKGILEWINVINGIEVIFIFYDIVLFW